MVAHAREARFVRIKYCRICHLPPALSPLDLFAGIFSLVVRRFVGLGPPALRGRAFGQIDGLTFV